MAKTKHILHKFDNISDLHTYCQQAKTNTTYQKHLGEHYLSSKRTNCKADKGTDTWDEAQNLLQNGDLDAAAKIQSYFVKLTKQNKQQAPRMRPAVVGVVPVVGAYLTGDPRAMLAKKNVPTKAKVLTIVYNCAIDWQIEGDEIAQVGAKLLAACNAIEKSGCRLNIYMAQTSYRGNEELTVCTRVKTDGQRFNVGQIAYPLANTSFLRRHMFRLMETSPEIKGKLWCNNYGYVVSGSEAEKQIKNAGFKFDKYLDFYMIRHQTPQQIADAIAKGK